MQRLVAALAMLVVAGCAEKEIKKVEVDISKRLSPGCYTVDLFDPYTIHRPEENVPDEWRDFLGVWKNGAWGGHWCHDLYVTKVHADGRVDLLDAYGPYRDYGIEATVFKRQGRIVDGVLTFLSQGGSPVKYRLVGDYLVGSRKGALGKFEITMSREEGLAMIPIPPKKPVRRS